MTRARSLQGLNAPPHFAAENSEINSESRHHQWTSFNTTTPPPQQSALMLGRKGGLCLGEAREQARGHLQPSDTRLVVRVRPKGLPAPAWVVDSGPPKIHLGSGFQDRQRLSLPRLESFPAFAVGAGVERSRRSSSFGGHTAPLGGAAEPARLSSSSSSWGLAALLSDSRPKAARPGPGRSGHQLGRVSGRARAAASDALLFAVRLGAPGEERVLGLSVETSGVRSHGPSLGFQSAKGDLRQNPVSASAQLESKLNKARERPAWCRRPLSGVRGFLSAEGHLPLTESPGLRRRRDSLGFQAPARL